MIKYCEKGPVKPSSEEWLREAKQSSNADKIGMYLVHNGVVRKTPKKEIYNPGTNDRDVTGMQFSSDIEKADALVEECLKMDGIYYIRVWLADGRLNVGDDIMQVIIGADSRPHCVDALQKLVPSIKNGCVAEKELFD